jgi:alkanesulfonate monooxygenase SsuD/methylene tetrahydromethanopterin reductase-like flavin-dependent oxidoreductase (luciferase family)
VKSIYFHLMPYPDLPEDFPARHRSVWVDIDPNLFDPAVGSSAYHVYLDELQFAASVGFDGVGVNEHHANGYGLMPSPNLMAAILARTCPTGAIVILGDSAALYNPPIRVAEELSMIDCLSGGRLVAGFPVGSPMDTAFAYGQNPTTLRDKYYEAVDLIVRAWTAGEVFSFNGNYWKSRYVNCWPRPVQRPHPPIWVPASSSVDTWEWCARKDLPYLYLSYFGKGAAVGALQGYWDTMERLGCAPNPFAAGFIQFVGVAESTEEALKVYREPAEYFFNRSLHVFPGFADPPGYKTTNTIRAGVEGMLERAARESAARAAAGTGMSRLSFEEMVEKEYVIIGSPDEVAEKLIATAKELNFGRLIALCHFGNMSRDVALHNAELMGTQVLPQLRPLFEAEWEDRWWPTVLAEPAPSPLSAAQPQ